MQMEILHRLVPWKKSQSSRRRDKGLSVSAIKGYRLALGQVFVMRGMDLPLAREMAMLFRSFEKSCPPREVKPPQWNVALVLDSLRGPP